jgi:hypothetical protein
MEIQEDSTTDNQENNTMIPAPAVTMGAAPRTPNPTPQKTAKVLKLRNHDVTKSGGSKSHLKSQNKH